MESSSDTTICIYLFYFVAFFNNQTLIQIYKL